MKNIKEEISDTNMSKETEVLNRVIVEMQNLIDKGYDPKIVKEGFFEFFGKGNSAGSGIVQTFKKSILEYFISKLGLDPKSFMGQVITNAFANVEFKDYYRLFTDCKFTSEILAKTLLESFIDKWRIAAGMDSLIHIALKEVLTEAATNTETYKNLADKMSGFVCPMLKEISSKIDLNPLKKISG